MAEGAEGQDARLLRVLYVTSPRCLQLSLHRCVEDVRGDHISRVHVRVLCLRSGGGLMLQLPAEALQRSGHKLPLMISYYFISMEFCLLATFEGNSAITFNQE